MANPIKTIDAVSNGIVERFEIVQKYEVIDAMYGMSHIRITDKDIRALKDGKYLYFTDGEYAQVISYKSEDEK